jgi:hypothetical protein
MILALFTGIAYNGFCQKDEEPKVPPAMAPYYYKSVGAPMPPLNVKTTEDKTLTSRDLRNKANLFLMIFNPLCDHCQLATQKIIGKIDALNKSHFVLIAAPDMKQYMPTFDSATHISKYPKLQVGYDSLAIARLNTFMGLPQVNIYDRDRKLIKVLTSDFPIDSLVKYME